MKIVILAVLVIATYAVIPIDIANCQSTGQITMNACTLSIKPTKGQDETITVYATATDYVEVVKVHNVNKWQGVEVQKQDFDFVHQYGEDDSVIFVQTANFPTFTPSGKIISIFTFLDAKDQVLGCGQIEFTI